ncbi:uncharacterized protein BO66DRAFT_443033 [Aspergillus aculeatinus CBS 121060]|uniref:Uncharacterized protein n=1 Tax=Aspergillus aculeatinus CBS 121060 TaxID=1448322 RepID=A0ACD1GWC8_9EURO|nr:hypothetical protein BO66DRAFT_443033 [Aspergillus aculeatinus CBS 121060]RAH65494.1 hypothetical protein BO66DRAFT_443033 [Aspergillus aculeatinus CBS 121060]
MANLPDTLPDLPPYSWDHSKRFGRKSRVAENVLRPQAPRHALIGLHLAEGNDLEPQWRVLLRADDHPWIRQHRFQNKNAPLSLFETMNSPLGAGISGSVLGEGEVEVFGGVGGWFEVDSWLLPLDMYRAPKSRM